MKNMKYWAILYFLQLAFALNYTGETALLDAAPLLGKPNSRHPTAVTFAELGVFDFSQNSQGHVSLELGAFSSDKSGKQHEVELDRVYVIFASARQVNNFVAKLYLQQKHNGYLPILLCSDVTGWLPSVFITSVSSLPKHSNKPNKTMEQGTETVALPTVAFTSADPHNAPRPTAPGSGGRNPPAQVKKRSPANTGNMTLLDESQGHSDGFLVEYEWEWPVKQAGHYAVLVANCAATTIQFKYNLVMANRQDKEWTHLPAGWMPVQKIYPAVCYTLWGLMALLWMAEMLVYWKEQKSGLVIAMGVVPILRLASCVADHSRYGAWGQTSYESTMVAVSTSVVDALADSAQCLCVLALAKGWGVVRGRLAGGERRLVPGVVAFVGVATLYDGATRGGGVLSVGVLQVAASVYMWASLRHTRHMAAVHILRLVSGRNENGLRQWYQGGGYQVAKALRLLAKQPKYPVASDQGLALLWCAVRKSRLLRLVHLLVVPLQLLSAVVVLTSGFAIPTHWMYVGLLLNLLARWLAYASMYFVMFWWARSTDRAPQVRLPALPAISTRRSVPQYVPGQQPGLGRLQIFGR